MAGVNDTAEDAAELANLCADQLSHQSDSVNPIKERSYRQPDDSAVHAFRKKLEKQAHRDRAPGDGQGY